MGSQLLDEDWSYPTRGLAKAELPDKDQRYQQQQNRSCVSVVNVVITTLLILIYTNFLALSQCRNCELLNGNQPKRSYLMRTSATGSSKEGHVRLCCKKKQQLILILIYTSFLVLSQCRIGLISTWRGGLAEAELPDENRRYPQQQKVMCVCCNNYFIILLPS